MIWVIIWGYIAGIGFTFAGLCIREMIHPVDQPYFHRLGIVALLALGWLPVGIFIVVEWGRYRLNKRRRRINPLG